MSNMAYCRFENTLSDLEDCYEHMDDSDLSESEKKARDKILKLCYMIASDFLDDDGNIV